ncbi:hypothetical protein [Thermocrinis sp.]|uniref:hypothetical protein n=1 Tax=Thermocrinis sp. TaxID=2024383 RepID=UPI002FDE644D
MDFFYSLLKVFLSLAIVIVLILIVIPYIQPMLVRFSLKGGSKGNVKIINILPLLRGTFIVELEIKGIYMVILITERGADVIHRDSIDN